eukprot:scaffold72807_cov23-Tisochrysis_lutea.AAC.1
MPFTHPKKRAVHDSESSPASQHRPVVAWLHPNSGSVLELSAVIIIRCTRAALTMHGCIWHGLPVYVPVRGSCGPVFTG